MVFQNIEWIGSCCIEMLFTKKDALLFCKVLGFRLESCLHTVRQSSESISEGIIAGVVIIFLAWMC